jgi:hypothetical protein
VPITREQLDQETQEAILQWITKVHELLSANRDKAYSEDELYLAFHRVVPGAIGSARERRQVLKEALHRLLDRDAVEIGIVDGDLYYAYKGELTNGA